MYQLVFYVPHTHLECVKRAVFTAGAGRLNNYDSCSWQTQGQGQFKPLQGSEPFIGQQGMLEVVNEYRVEMVVTNDDISNVVAALKSAHPYEIPAYHVIKRVDF